jgi:hypothetical protein
MIAWLRFHGLRWALLLLVALVVQLAFPPPTLVYVPGWALGAPADRTVVAPFAFVVRKTDEEITREGLDRAQQVRPVYRFDSATRDSSVVALREFLAVVEAATLSPSAPSVIVLAGETRSVRLSRDEAEWLARSPRRRAMADSLLRFVNAMLSAGVADAGQVRAERASEVNLIRDDRERQVPRNALITFSDYVERSDRAAVPEEDALGQRVFRRIAASFFQPTVILDQPLTASRRGQLRLGVDSLRFRVRAGERVVAEGEPVTAEIRDKLTALRTELRDRQPRELLGRTFAGGLLVNGLMLLPFWLLLRLYRRETWRSLREMLFLAGLFALAALLASGLMRAFPDRVELLPVPLAALVIAMLYSGRVAVVAALVLAVVLGEQWVLSPTPALFLSALTGVVAALGVRAIRRRSRLYVTISLLVLAFALGSAASGLLRGWTLDETIGSFLIGYLSAVASVSVAMLLLPLAEIATRRTTDLTLLELADPSRPLLRRLAVEAPGTWAHSLMMANLCESACTAIGANGLLARVGCYYHDVGKLARPQFFVENQGRGGNPHDQLSPGDSAAIIRAHVGDGLALANAARLPESVAAFIPEHHGTGEIRYFLHRASEARGSAEIDPSAFRYPGPSPRSRETAVVMLADSVEAVVRTLQKPTPEAVRNAINEMIGQRVASGQLDDAPLTLRDLDRVREEFARVLSGQFHNRVQYPVATPSASRVFRSSTEIASRG